ncbi:MAG: hypothetical protein AAFX78_14685 [Cyanobacteria bacterium J06638_20]
MAIKPRQELKGEFVTGGKIKKTAIDDWHDSYVHKSELGVLLNVPAGGASAVLSAGGFIDRIIVSSATAQDVSIGTAPGGTQVVDNQPVAANGHFIHAEDFFANNAPLTLYFTSPNPITVRIRKTQFT